VLPAIRIKASDKVALTAIQPRAGAPTTQRAIKLKEPLVFPAGLGSTTWIGPPRLGERVTILLATLESLHHRREQLGIQTTEDKPANGGSVSGPEEPRHD
jgi:hypothetical protein